MNREEVKKSLDRLESFKRLIDIFSLQFELSEYYLLVNL